MFRLESCGKHYGAKKKPTADAIRNFIYIFPLVLLLIGVSLGTVSRGPSVKLEILPFKYSGCDFT